MRSPSSVTELLSRVDWSQMQLTGFGKVRLHGLCANACPLEVATGSAYRYTDDAAELVGVDRDQLKVSIWPAADNTRGFTPISARWRQWMLEHIALAHAEIAHE